MFIKKITKAILSGLLLGAMVVSPAGCDSKGGGGGDTTPPTAPTYESAYDELKDIPNQIDVQIKWVTAPIDEAHALGGEFNALVDSLGITAEQLGGMASASFKDGKIEISADLNIAEDKKAEVEAFLGKVKQAGLNCTAIPKRAQKVVGYLTKVPMKMPALGKKALDELKAQVTAAAGDAKAELEASIAGIPDLQKQIVDKSKASITDVKALPADAKGKVEELVLAFSGKGEFKASASAEVGGEAGGGDDMGGDDMGGDDMGGEEAGGEEEGGEEAAEGEDEGEL